MLSLEEALNAPDGVREVYIDCSGLTRLPAAVLEFTELESLRLNDCEVGFEVVADVSKLSKLNKLDISGPADGSLAFPEAFFECPITDLEIRKLRVREVAQFGERLKRFRMASKFIFEDILPLTKAFSALEYLEIWGYHAKNAADNVQSFELPPEIHKLTQLAELEIVSAAMLDLPEEFAALERLHTIRLRNHHFTSIPVALTRLPSLRELEFSHNTQLKEIPSAVAEMKALKRLSLKGSLNGGALPLRYEEPQLEPVPESLGLFPSLTDLNMDHCGVPEIGAIAKLTGLEKLSLEWTAVTDLSPLAALSSLSELNLEHAWATDLTPLSSLKSLKKLSVANTYVKTFEGLAGCAALESLDISRSRADDNPMRALEPLVELEHLHEIISDNLKEHAWKDLRDSDALVAEEIAAALESPDYATAEEAIRSVVEYSLQRSNQDMNALLAFFGFDEDLMSEPEYAEFEPLVTALNNHGAELPSSLLSDIVQATFVNMCDGWSATTTACELLIARKDLEAQKKVIETFVAAGEYYDPGHRWYENSVHDQFIDDLFPRFESEALAVLLSHLGRDALNGEYGDNMEPLFIPAFAGLTTPDPGLLGALEAYVMEQVEESYGSDPQEAHELIVAALEASRGEVAVALGALRNRHEKAVEAAAVSQIAEEAPDESESESEVAQAPAETFPDHECISPAEVGQNLQTAFEGDVDEFLAALDVVPKVENKTTASFVAAFTNNKLIESLKAGKLDDGVRLATAYAGVAADVGWAEGNMRNNLASNTLVLAVHAGDEEVEKLVFEKLMPPRISHTPLAFNVACFWATKGDKTKMCAAIVEAIGLGKRPEQFVADSDFAAYLEDPEFLAALNS